MGLRVAIGSSVGVGHRSRTVRGLQPSSRAAAQLRDFNHHPRWESLDTSTVYLSVPCQLFVEFIYLLFYQMYLMWSKPT